MQVILLEPIQGVGKLGDVVNVKTGYARNFLLPQHKALRASDENLAELKARQAELEKEQSAKIKEAEKVAEALTDYTVKLERPASETGQLYGSVKARDIADDMTGNGHSVEASMVQIGQPIREVGEHSVNIALHPEVIVSVTVTVERQSN